jgi:protein-ribulosamine 3-kinase
MSSPIPIAITEAVTAAISRKAPAAITAFIASTGGCINHGGRLATTVGDFFLKWNRTYELKGMFEAESKGLEILRATRALYVPAVIATEDLGEYQYLLLEYVEQSSRRRDYWTVLGQHLATLHRATAPSCGLDHNNYIGSLPQSNQPNKSWRDFFVFQRLDPLVERAIQKRLAPPAWHAQFEQLYKKLDSLLPNENPSLLHGDLWEGNVIVDALGAPCLIDPAIYYGHREVDLAMSKLFGEFEASFYDAYHESFPLLPGFEQRFEIYNLYPLLVHLHLFGASYVTPIQSTLTAFA